MNPILKTDYHVHPDYSNDALPVSVYEYCSRALELSLDEICFTTHFEVDKKRDDNYVYVNRRKYPITDLRWLDYYFKEIEEAQMIFKDRGLNVKTGLEVGFSIDSCRIIEKAIDNFPFDFILGAVHCLDHISLASLKESSHYFSQKSLTDLKRDYFQTLEAAVQSGLFDCIAHLDIYRRHGYSFYGPDILNIHQGIIEPIFEEMARKNIGLEVNTSSLRRGMRVFHPSPEIFSLAVKSGVSIFTIGSDAHRLNDLGSYIDEALLFLQKRKVQNHTFTRRIATPCETLSVS